jgi:hypothetical protein
MVNAATVRMRRERSEQEEFRAFMAASRGGKDSAGRSLEAEGSKREVFRKAGDGYITVMRKLRSDAQSLCAVEQSVFGRAES